MATESQSCAFTDLLQSELTTGLKGRGECQALIDTGALVTGLTNQEATDSCLRSLFPFVGPFRTSESVQRLSLFQVAEHLLGHKKRQGLSGYDSFYLISAEGFDN